MSTVKSVPESAKKHNDYSLQLIRWFLISIGTWPQTSTSTVLERLSAIMLIPICSFIVMIITIPCLFYMLFEAQDIKSKLHALAPLIHRIMGSINYWTLLNRSDDIRNCMQHMETDWRLIQRREDRELMIQHAKIARSIIILCAVLMLGSAIFFNAARMVKTVTIIIDDQNVTMHLMNCPLYQKFIDARFSPMNEIMMILQFASGLVSVSSTVCICGLAAVFALHAKGQLSVLFGWLNEVTEEESLAERRLATVVEHHLRVLSFVARVESIMNKACFGELMGCTITMCVVGYYAIANWANFDTAKIISSIVVYSSMGFNILIFCYIGEILTEQCKNVGEMAYMTNWYKLRHKTALAFVMIMIRSSNVIKITAGKLFQLSLATFGDVLKSSIVYLNILKTMAM